MLSVEDSALTWRLPSHGNCPLWQLGVLSSHPNMATALYGSWESRIAIMSSTVALIKSIVGVLIYGHWTATLWALQVSR